MSLRYVLPILLLFVLAACTGPAPAPSPSAPPAPTTAVPDPATPAPPPTATTVPATATPTATLAPLLSPTPASLLPAPSPTPGLPAQLITAENLASVQPLRSVGYGSPLSAVISADSSTLIVGTTAGLAWFSLPDLEHLRFDPIAAVYGLALSPDETTLAVATFSAAGSPVTELRRVADNELLFAVAGSEPQFSPSGDVLLTVTAAEGFAPDTTVFWQTADGSEVARISDIETSFSPDGRYLATWNIAGRREPVTRVFSADGFTELFTVSGAFPAFHPAGDMLAVTYNNEVRLYDLPTGNEMRRFELGFVSDQLGWVYAVPAFQPEAEQLVVAGIEELLVWDLASGERIAAAELNLDQLEPEVRFAPDADLLASLTPPLGDCPPAGVSLIRSDDGTAIYTDSLSYDISFAPAGDYAALLSINALRVLDLAGDELRTLAMPGFLSMALSPDGAFLATANLGQGDDLYVINIDRWDIAGGTRRDTALRTEPGLFAVDVSDLQYSQAGDQISALVSEGCAAYFSRMLTSWPLDPAGASRRLGELPADADQGFQEFPSSSDFRDDAEYLAWVADGTAYLQSVTAEPQTISSAADARVVAFAPGGELWLGTADGSVGLVDPATAAFTAVFETEAAVTMLGFAPDGNLLAVQQADGLVVFYDREQEQVIGRVQVEGAAQQLSISSDKELLIALLPGGIEFYSIAEGARLERIAGGASAIAMGPGQRLLAALVNNRVIFYGIAE
jgi:WD40 repeat protein